MADTSKQYSLDVLERLWIQKALELQIKSLQRSVQNEINGSDIHVLRGKEMAFLVNLKGKIV